MDNVQNCDSYINCWLKSTRRLSLKLESYDQNMITDSESTYVPFYLQSVLVHSENCVKYVHNGSYKSAQ
jgi:hypothetical protein